jgi:hypothetical protein
MIYYLSDCIIFNGYKMPRNDPDLDPAGSLISLTFGSTVHEYGSTDLEKNSALHFHADPGPQAC